MIVILSFIASCCLFLGRIASVRPAWDMDSLVQNPQRIRTVLVPQILGGTVLILPALIFPVLLCKIHAGSVKPALAVYGLLVFSFSLLLHAMYTHSLVQGFSRWQSIVHAACRSLMAALRKPLDMEMRILEGLGMESRLNRFSIHLESRIQYLNLLKNHAENGSHSNQNVIKLMDNLNCLVNYSAREVLRPSSLIVTVSESMDVRQALERAALTGFSRLPVLDRQGKVIGVFRSNQLELLSKLKVEVVSEMDEALFFSPESSVYEILKTLQRHSRQMGVIQDQQAFFGVITMEDILELLVGDIQDEFDAPLIKKTGPETWEADARISMGALRKVLDGLNIQNPSQTLSGFLKVNLGDSILEGGFLETEGLRFEVIRVQRTSVERVRILRKH